MAMREPAVRLFSVGIPYASEASSSDKDGANNVSDGPDNGLAQYHATMIMEGIMRSLTHTKGNVLSQMLGGDDDDDCSDLGGSCNDGNSKSEDDGNGGNGGSDGSDGVRTTAVTVVAMANLRLQPAIHPHHHHRHCSMSKQGTINNSEQGEWIASNPTNGGNTQAGGKAVFRQHPVCIGGLLVQQGWCK